MKHIPIGNLSSRKIVRILVETYFEQFKSMLQKYATDSEDEYEIDLPYGRTLAIVHETDGLEPKDQFWSWRVHCSSQEFDERCYYKTDGIIDKLNTKKFNDRQLKKNLAWAIHVALHEFDD